MFQARSIFDFKETNPLSLNTGGSKNLADKEEMNILSHLGNWIRKIRKSQPKYV